MFSMAGLDAMQCLHQRVDLAPSQPRDARGSLLETQLRVERHDEGPRRHVGDE
jgi:hypothetical protein